MKLPLNLLATVAIAAALCLPHSGMAQAPPPADAGVQAPATVLVPPVASPGNSPTASGVKSSSPSPTGRPAESGVGHATKPYLIGPLDVLDIRVWKDPNLSGPVAVRPDGFISVPLLGELQAAGLTQQELSKAISDKLTETRVDNPDVNVQVAKYNSKKYFIFGEVNRPGEFPLIGETTVLDAFANCGGFREFANSKKIYILRGKDRLKFNYKRVSQGKDMEQNVAIENGDRIFVP